VREQKGVEKVQEDLREVQRLALFWCLGRYPSALPAAIVAVSGREVQGPSDPLIGVTYYY